MTEKLRFGIIGGGVIGPTHAQAIGMQPDAELVAVTDVAADKAQKLAGKFSVTPYQDVQEMLAQERLDIVNVRTPSGMHGEYAIQAMRAGCHVIVEKPMEITLTKIDEMLRVQQETGRKLAVISQHRFDPASQQVHTLVEEQAFGKTAIGAPRSSRTTGWATCTWHATRKQRLDLTAAYHRNPGQKIIR